jgi:hypothetical protein
MHGGHPDQTRFDLLSQTAQQRLRARVADAEGDITVVANEIRAQLDELDREIANRPEVIGDRQADRAFFVAQLIYLDMLVQAQVPSGQPRARGWLARLRALFGRARTA